MPRLPVVLLLALLPATAAPATEAPAGPAARTADAASQIPAPPALRLPAGARPVRYSLDLTLSPESETFSGQADIELEMASPLPLLWLNATDLEITKASLSGGEKTLPLRVVPGNDDFIGLAAEKPLGPGRGTLHLAYTGQVSSKDTSGLFRQKEGDDWYLFSQFENTDARRAFPCFDEPGFKTPYRITLRVRKDLMAVSNAPVASEKETGGGMNEVRFAETKPLPTYLVAVGVGPFEATRTSAAGSKKVPFRILAPRGEASQASYAARSTPEILSLLEKYFGQPYPYEKLDFLAIPLAGFAMEHPGLVTFGRRLLLTRPEDESAGRQRGFGATAAHELAHMWFGDLVTMKWWDDTWLNESFASWMGNRIVEEWKPEWDVPSDRVEEREEALGADRLVSARRIRQPIESKDDIENAFDTITYAKGSAILTMLERWIGPERFRKGVQGYLADHAWGNADAAGFFASLSREAGADVAPVFSSFLDQAGVPLVTARVICAGGSPPRLRLEQKRYLPVGSRGSSDQTWKIPVCVRYGSGGTSARQCALLKERSAEFPLEGATACPEWILPNDSASGYYISRLETVPDSPGAPGPIPLFRLFEDGGSRLTVPERIAVLADYSALVLAGQAPLEEVLSLIPPVVREGKRQTVTLAAGIVGELSLNLVPPDLSPNYRRYVNRTFGPLARSLAFAGREGEPEDAQLLRPVVLSLVAIRGEDAALQKEARSLARRWLRDHRAVSGAMVDVVLRSAARHGDRALFEEFRAAAARATDRTERENLLEGLGAFQDPGLVRKRLSLFLTGEFDPREAQPLVMGGLGDAASREATFSFIKGHYDDIVSKMPKEYEAYLPYTGASFCDEAHLSDVEKFFGERTSRAPGAPRILAQVLEGIDLCIARKKAEQPGLEAFLRKE